MIYRLQNKIQPYAWGTKDYIPQLLGKDPTGKPQAELWMGTHPKGPSNIIVDGNSILLEDFVKRKNLPELDYMFKVLSAREALSIQVHPGRAQAREGFEREEKAGIDKNAFNRNYKDPNPKPELVMSLTGVWALVGFRNAQDIAHNISAYAPILDELAAALSQTGDIKLFYEGLMKFKRKLSAISQAAEKAAMHDDPMSTWITKLHNQYPDDISCLAPAILNLVYLEPGEAVFLEAGVLHSYLHGNMLELMSNSDNVLRGGLTGKYIDLPELLNIVSFQEHQVAVMSPAKRYHASHLLLEVAGEAKHRSNRILLCIDGSGKIISDETFEIRKGDSFFVPATEDFEISGEVLVYSATSQ